MLEYFVFFSLSLDPPDLIFKLPVVYSKVYNPYLQYSQVPHIRTDP